MRFIGRLFALSVITAAFARTAAAQSEVDTAAIIRAVQDEMRDRKAPGASVAVVRDGRVVWTRAFGVRSIETGEPMTDETLLRIGSITKTVTAVAALLLEHDGKLRLDAPIGTYAPDLAPALRGLTMRQLLTHTAGLVNEGAGNGAQDETALATRVKSWGAAKLFTQPREIYAYSSPGFWLAGYIIERLEKKPYADVIDARIITPLGMRRSTFRPTVALTHPLAIDHRLNAQREPEVVRPYPNDATTWPSGSLFASATGLGRFAAALLNDGIVDGVQVIPREVARKMAERDPLTVIAPSDCGYSFGLGICDRGGVRVLSHYGFRGGSGSVFSLAPSKHTAVVVLANVGGAIMTRVEAAALGLPRPDQPTSSNAHDRTRAAAAAGLYVAGGDTLHLQARGDSAWYWYGSQAKSPARVTADGRVLVMTTSGEVEQEFQLVQGRSKRWWYLHDGLNAWRRSSTNEEKRQT
jgi:CubicO group peptidase (beta-lactamase class C family)